MAQIVLCVSHFIWTATDQLLHFRVHLVDCVNLICCLDSWWKGFRTPSFVTLPLELSSGFTPLSACVSSTGVCSNASLLSWSIDLMGGSLPCLCSPIPGCRSGPIHSPPHSPSFPSTYWFVPGSIYSFSVIRDSTNSQLVLCENFCICGCIPDASMERDCILSPPTLPPSCPSFSRNT